MKFFYCQSYQIFNLALFESDNEDITVITSTKNIIDACKYLNIPYIEHVCFTRFDIIFKKYRINKSVRKILTIVGNSELHFSHTQFAVFCFILIAEGNRRKSNIFFHNFEFVYPRIYNIKRLNLLGLGTYIQVLLLKLLYGIPFELAKVPLTYIISLRLDFICQNFSIINDKDEYNLKTLEFFKKQKFIDININNLFIAQVFEGNKQLINENKLNQVLEKINNSEWHVKLHPRLSKSSVLINKMIPLETYIPVEMFFNSIKQNIVSFHSASLITASSFDNVCVISLIKLVGIDSDFRDKVISDLSKKSNNKIHFPESFEDFEKIIS
jgi:hypothetical protein